MRLLPAVRAISVLSVLVSSVLFSSCGSGSASGPKLPKLTQISVVPAGPSLPKGSSLQLTATGTFDDGTKQALTASVTWQSSQAAIAEINSQGVVAAMSQGVAQVSATYQGITGSTSVTVAQPALASIAVSPNPSSLPVGASEQLTATATLTDGTIQNVTQSANWSSSTAAATVAANGSAKGVATGTTTITASVGSINGTAALTITAAQVVSLAVTPANSSLPLGESAQFTAMATYSDGTLSNLSSSANWSSSATGVATVTATGLVKGVALGATTITASVGSISGSTALAVGSAQVVSIAVNPSTSSVPAGRSEQLSAVASYSDGTTRDATASVTWGSSAPALATVIPGGLATGVTVGTAMINASLGAITGSASLTVTAPVPVSLSVAPSTSQLLVAESEALVATATLSDGTSANVSNSAAWSSSATAIATVDATGKVTGISIGTATIRATLGTLSASATVNVFIPDATVRIANPGTAGETNLCAMIYVFDNDQQLAECCGCITTPNGLRTLSVQNDLTNNTLTGQTLVNGSIKLVSAAVNASPCDPTSNVTPVPALRSWSTHVQDHEVGGYPVTESTFTKATLSATELSILQADCYFANRLGSGQGTCTCGSGD